MPRTKQKNASMKVKAPGARKNVNNLKYEIASEFGVTLGPKSSSRDNGLVGGEMTKRLVEKGKKSKSRTAQSRTRKKKNLSNK